MLHKALLTLNIKLQPRLHTFGARPVWVSTGACVGLVKYFGAPSTAPATASVQGASKVRPEVLQRAV